MASGTRARPPTVTTLLVALWLSCWVAIACGDSGRGVAVTYVGNEGFLIEGGGTKVLIDALYRNGVDGYVVMPPARRSLLENARPPFDAVDLVLASHVHPDHFDPLAVGAHLATNPAAVFLSTEQATARLRSEFNQFEAIEDRVVGLHPPEGERIRTTVNGVPVQVINLHHGRDRPYQNLGLLFEVGGKTLLHIGDTEATEADFDLYRLAADRIDIAFIPYWHLLEEEGRGAIARAIRPERIVVMHVPPPDNRARHIVELGGWSAMLDLIEREVPNAYVFRKEMATRRYR